MKRLRINHIFVDVSGIVAIKVKFTGKHKLLFRYWRKSLSIFSLVELEIAQVVSESFSIAPGR